MKKQILFFACTLVFAFVAITAQAQPTTATPPKQEFALKAKEIDSLAMLLLPAVQKVREAAARSFASVLADARTLAAKVEKAGSKMTESQYQGFQRELQALCVRLDKIDSQSGGTAGGPAGCMQECDAAYPGWGGGKGWNRFWCKTACLKIKINLPGGGGAGVGGE